MTKTINNNVEHPSHYNTNNPILISEDGQPISIECVDVVRNMPFWKGNAIKYIWRAGLKEGNSELDDLKKAIWYLYDRIDHIEQLGK